jgi:hypothetical protein
LLLAILGVGQIGYWAVAADVADKPLLDASPGPARP